MNVWSGRTHARQAGGLARVGQVEDAVCGGAVRRPMRDCGGWGGKGRRGGSTRLFRVQGQGGSGRSRGRSWGAACFCTAQEQTKDTVSSASVCLKMTRKTVTHVARLLGLECMIFEAWVPPTPGTNGEVLFFASWCLPLKDRKSPLNIFWRAQ